MSLKKLLVFVGLVWLTAQPVRAESPVSSDPKIQPAEERFSDGPAESQASGLAENLGPCRILKGDINGDEVLDLDDVVQLSNCIFLGTGNCAACFVGDTNCDNMITPADLVKLILAIYWERPVLC